MNNLSKNNINLWESRYAMNSKVAKYPFDMIVSLVMRRFGNTNIRKNIKILDYGCGGGANYGFLLNEGFDAYACDVSITALNLCKDIALNKSIKLEDDHFLLVNNDDLLFPDELFDAIVDRESLCQSNWNEIQSRVSDFKRILKPNGWYLGINFTDLQPDLRYADYLGHGDYNNFKNGLFKGQGRRHLFSINEIKELFGDWKVCNVWEQKIVSILGDPSDIESSEFIIAAQKK